MANYYIRSICDKLDERFGLIENICIKRWYVIMISKVLISLFKIHNPTDEVNWINEDLWGLSKPLNKLADFYYCFCLSSEESEYVIKMIHRIDKDKYESIVNVKKIMVSIENLKHNNDLLQTKDNNYVSGQNVRFSENTISESKINPGNAEEHFNKMQNFFDNTIKGFSYYVDVTKLVEILIKHHLYLYLLKEDSSNNELYLNIYEQIFPRSLKNILS